jgi:DNA-binding NtrC family response regulator
VARNPDEITGGRHRILIVDDDPDVHRVLDAILAPRYRVVHAATPDECLRSLDNDDPSTVLLDLHLGSGIEQGLDLLGRLCGSVEMPSVVVLSSYQDTDTVVRAMKLGAAHFVGKTPRFDELLGRIELVIRERRTRFHLDAHRQSGPAELVGSSAAMEEVRRLARAAARSRIPVLILGETGTGKGLLASCIHRWSALASGPYRDVNVAGLPSSVLDSELFGHERGSFTGADRRRRGLFELAAGGTILLDEIGDLPRESQVKLLKVVDEGTFRRIGGEEELSTDTRVLAATHANLEEMVKEGTFRSDLFHRLAGLVLPIPPLRERLQDVLELASAFLGEDVVLTAAAREALSSHSWPGNVRELQQTLRRAALLAERGTIDVVHLGVAPPDSAGAPGPEPGDELLFLRPYADSSAIVVERFRRDYLTRLLDRCGGNVSRAARESGISRPHLHALLRQMGMGRKWESD